MSKIRTSVGLVSGEDLFLGLQMATFSLCLHTALPLCPSMAQSSVFIRTPVMLC